MRTSQWHLSYLKPASFSRQGALEKVFFFIMICFLSNSSTITRQYYPPQTCPPIIQGFISTLLLLAVVLFYHYQSFIDFSLCLKAKRWVTFYYSTYAKLNLMHTFKTPTKSKSL